jgi:hypothetical protein
MSQKYEQLTININTTQYGWQHILHLLRQESDPAWKGFTRALIEDIEYKMGYLTTGIAYEESFGASMRSNQDDDYPSQYEFDDSEAQRERELEERAMELGFDSVGNYLHWLEG